MKLKDENRKPSNGDGSEYTAEAIHVLKGLEAVRKKTSDVYRRCWRERITSPRLRGC
jgi:hypothetical protein